MSETLMRQWMMLQCLPRAPRKIDAGRIERVLAEAGYKIDRRSIQRDLVQLQMLFPLECDTAHKPFGWSWARTAPSFDLPGLDVHAAVAWRQAGEHLRPLLPEPSWQHLEPQIRRADAVLAQLEGNRLAHWPDKVRVVPPGPPLQPPLIDAAVLEHVHRGLLDECQLTIVYRRRAESEPRTYTAHPLGLVWRGAIGYLIVTLFDYPDPIHLVLHRMADVQVLAAARRVPTGFDLDAYVGSRAFDFVVSDVALPLVVRMPVAAAVKLIESPLAADQQVTPDGEAHVRIAAMVDDTNELRAWLRSFGHWIEVLEPASLRAELAQTAAALAAMYG